MSPLPSSCSAPLPSRIVRESILDDTLNETRAGRFALIRPVMTSTDGRCVARIRWIPTARAICASRAIDSSTSLPATIIRSASSSITTTTFGMCVISSGSAASRVSGFSSLRPCFSASATLWLKPDRLRTPSQFISL